MSAASCSSLDEHRTAEPCEKAKNQPATNIRLRDETDFQLGTESENIDLGNVVGHEQLRRPGRWLPRHRDVKADVAAGAAMPKADIQSDRGGR